MDIMEHVYFIIIIALLVILVIGRPQRIWWLGMADAVGHISEMLDELSDNSMLTDRYGEPDRKRIFWLRVRDIDRDR